MLLCAYYFLKAMLTDPGVIPRGDLPPPPVDTSKQQVDLTQTQAQVQQNMVQVGGTGQPEEEVLNLKKEENHNENNEIDKEKGSLGIENINKGIKEFFTKPRKFLL